MKYSDEQRLEKISEYVEKLIQFIEDKGITREIIDEDESVRWALTTPLYNIGEHVYNLSDSLKEQNASIPWAKISGLRHRLVHDYDNTNWSIISDVVFDVIPEFREQLAGVITEDSCSEKLKD